MAGVTTSDALHRPREAVRETAIEEREALPVKVWAAIGGLVLAFEAFVMVKWITGPNFTPVHTGVTPVPGWMKGSLVTMEIGFTLLWLWCIWHFIVRPLRTDGRMSTDGLLCLGFFVFCWFQDPLADYGGAVFTHNSYLVNIGSWLPYRPRPVLPRPSRPHLPYPL